MIRIIILRILMIIFISGCSSDGTHIVFVKDNMDDEVSSGESEAYYRKEYYYFAYFAYGNYCGPGHPTRLMKEDCNTILNTCGYQQPIDELDALCYSHDLCYKRLCGSSDDALCDKVLYELLKPHINEPREQFCKNIIADIVAGLAIKLYFSHDSDVGYRELFEAAKRIFSKIFSKQSNVTKGGVCNIHYQVKMGAIITDFEERYNELREGGFSDLKVPIIFQPSDNASSNCNEGRRMGKGAR